MQGVGTCFPVMADESLMGLGLECDPIRTVHAMRATHAPQRPRQFLASAMALVVFGPEGISTGLELGIETRLHQLAHRFADPGIVASDKYTINQRLAFVIGHPTRLAPLVRRQRSRQPSFAHERP